MRGAGNRVQKEWRPVWHGGVIALVSVFFFFVVFWVAMGRRPLSGATAEWAAGFIVVSVVGLGTGTLATGAWIEVKDRQRSPFGRLYLAFILAALMLLFVVLGLFFWWLFDAQAGGTSR